MTEERFDVIVVGVGGMGSAAVYHLARRGQRVLGLERFDIPHQHGSSHGITRLIRMAYYEDPAYVPLVQRACELWHELEATAGRQLIYTTGSIDSGPEIFEGALACCRAHGLAHEVLDATEVARRWPAYRLPADTMALFQPDGGVLACEACIVAHVEAAHAHGGVVHARERVLGWEPTSGGVRVTTERGRYVAERIVVTAGAWTSSLLDLPPGLLVPERQVLGWLQPHRLELFQLERFPIYNLSVEEGRYYGAGILHVPGFKVGRYHHLEEQIDPDALSTEIVPADEAILRGFVERYFPLGAGPTMAMKVCMFTNTPDEHFVLDVHPDGSEAVIGAGFSGHGFKFCSVVGEILADLALEGITPHDIAFLRLGRPALAPHLRASGPA